MIKRIEDYQEFAKVKPPQVVDVIFQERTQLGYGILLERIIDPKNENLQIITLEIGHLFEGTQHLNYRLPLYGEPTIKDFRTGRLRRIV